jgi:glycosyltransferase involved in cell wall biosynthesis
MATAGRVTEVDAFLRSLAKQATDFEVIVVDQNSDDRLAGVIEGFLDLFPICHVRSPVQQLSHARNLGLTRCRGEFIGFPDDDCVYLDGFLASVDAIFRADPRLDALSGISVSECTKQGSGNRWRMERGPVALDTVWTSAISFNLFLRKHVIDRLGGFDETLGIGCRFGSGEETDLVVRALQAGATMIYDPALAVVHPDKSLTPIAVARAFSYAAGTGYVLGKHKFPLKTLLPFVVRPAGGLALSLATLRASHVEYYWKTLQGRLYGFVAGHRSRYSA